MARPKKAQAEQMTEWLAFRLTAAQREKIEQEAQRLDLFPSAYARQCTIKGTVRVIQDGKKADPDLLKALSAIGNNIHQISKRFNETRQAPEPEALSVALADLHHLVDDIRAAYKSHDC